MDVPGLLSPDLGRGWLLGWRPLLAPAEILSEVVSGLLAELGHSETTAYDPKPPVTTVRSQEGPLPVSGEVSNAVPEP